MSLKQVSSLFRSRGCRVVRENRGRTFTVIVLSVMGILSISACSSFTFRSLYENARQDTRTACLSQPPSFDRDKCLDQNSHSYDEYTRERERVRREEEAK
jgi:hypothetical protein